MCVCNPSIRTPFCGKAGCNWPNSKPEGARTEKVNSLLNRSKAQLAEDVETLVRGLMLLWGVEHPMSEWRDPRTALDQMRLEAQQRNK